MKIFPNIRTAVYECTISAMGLETDIFVGKNFQFNSMILPSRLYMDYKYTVSHAPLGMFMESVKKTFSVEAKNYDNTTFVLPHYDIMLSKAIKSIELPKDAAIRILDIGCGTGNLISLLKSKFKNASIFGIDFSQEMIDIARSKNGNDVELICADMFDLESLNLPQFDIILSSFVLHNLRTMGEHNRIAEIVNNSLSVGGCFIYVDLTEISGVDRERIDKKNVKRMEKNGLNDNDIMMWKKLMDEEDSPLSVKKVISILQNNGFESIQTFTRDDVSLFFSKKQVDPIQLKTELLVLGLRKNNCSNKIYKKQNPQDIKKTGNNGIFLNMGGLDALVSINHENNATSPYSLASYCDDLELLKYGVAIPVNIEYMIPPSWCFRKISLCENRPFSDFFVFEGSGYLHLAYKGCSFTKEEKCKFCSTERRKEKTDNDSKDISLALETVIFEIEKDIQICLGGGTYLPIEDNVQFFCEIIKTIRKNNGVIPIWVEMIPPGIEHIDALISAGATAFGFNLEIWDDSERMRLCPGKYKIASKTKYIDACKHVMNRIGPNTVGSCILVGIDKIENIIESIDYLLDNKIQPCLLPLKLYDESEITIDKSNISFYDPYVLCKEYIKLSKYASNEAIKKGVDIFANYGCMKCSCCTIMHDLNKKDAERD